MILNAASARLFFCADCVVYVVLGDIIFDVQILRPLEAHGVRAFVVVEADLLPRVDGLQLLVQLTGTRPDANKSQQVALEVFRRVNIVRYEVSQIELVATKLAHVLLHDGNDGIVVAH